MDDEEFDDGERWCETCHNTGEVDCYCGGDLCVCGGFWGNGTDPCPDCG
ncbi:hypothetical protein [Sphingomonas gilva]|nr:hypothetical protein [Sphingomonas gilva]